MNPQPSRASSKFLSSTDANRDQARAIAQLQRVALDAARALRVRDYGRVDLRLTETGEIYVIEVNANCYLERTGEFATAAAAAGVDYPTLINRIADAAIVRHRGGG